MICKLQFKPVIYYKTTPKLPMILDNFKTFSISKSFRKISIIRFFILGVYLIDHSKYIIL